MTNPAGAFALDVLDTSTAYAYCTHMAKRQRGGKPIAVKLTDEQRAQLVRLVEAHPTHSTLSDYIRGLIATAYATAVDEYNRRAATVQHNTSAQPKVNPFCNPTHAPNARDTNGA